MCTLCTVCILYVVYTGKHTIRNVHDFCWIQSLPFLLFAFSASNGLWFIDYDASMLSLESVCSTMVRVISNFYFLQTHLIDY